MREKDNGETRGQRDRLTGRRGDGRWAMGYREMGDKEMGRWMMAKIFF